MLNLIKSASDLFIGGTNIGWEIIGSFDAEMEVKNYSVAAYRK